MMTRKFGDTAPKSANFEASEERFEVPDLQESKRMLLKMAATPLKSSLKKTRGLIQNNLNIVLKMCLMSKNSIYFTCVRL